MIPNLTTTYLGMTLRSPLVVSASPLSESIENIKRMDGAGAGAIVLFSLFEEQIRTEQQIATFYERYPNATPAHIREVFPTPQVPKGIGHYLDHIRNAKHAVNIPIIASLNCMSLGTWTEFARQIEEAGADALELNIYFIPTDIELTAEQVEGLYLRILKAVKSAVSIPVAVKLSPFFTNMAHMVRRLDQAGVNALVLFNRFYEPDFDPRTLMLRPDIQLSTPQDSRLPLHWIAILFRKTRADLAATGGIYTGEDVVKMLMVGAKVTMMTSALLKEGIDHLHTVNQQVSEWLDQNDYGSVKELLGLTGQFNSNDPSAFERSEYMRTITFSRPIA